MATAGSRGISFNLPNEYGTFLADILNPIDITAFDWHNGNEEAYLAVESQLDEELFADLKAFPKFTGFPPLGWIITCMASVLCS